MMNQDDFYQELAKLFTESWRHDGNCNGVWLDIFTELEYEDYAKRVCEDCPVRFECLNAAIRDRDKFVRGGFNYSERQSLVNHQNRYNQYFEYDINGKALQAL